MTLEFTHLITADGSPTVRIGKPLVAAQIAVDGVAKAPEAMHSLKGAFSETLYIYGDAIKTCLELGLRPRVLSLGLGLGYVEILSTGLFLQAALRLSDTKRALFLQTTGGESFEALPELRHWFQSWVLGELAIVPGEFRAIYDSILRRTSEHLAIHEDKIKALLTELVASGRWQLRGALTASTAFDSRFGCICFDAFSSKTSPELWSEEFLLEFFAKVSGPGCVLSTYACTGALKRALRAQGFELSIRSGFSSKRDSTFGVKNK